jgi:flagellar FliL protein
MPVETTTRAATPRSVSKVTPAEADVKPKAKKSKKKLITIVVVLLVVAGAAYHFLLAKPATVGPPVAGAVVAMDDTTVNLTDGHFLKIKVGLQTIKGAPATIDTSRAEDLLITEFSDQTVAALSTQAGRDNLKKDLLSKIQAVYPKQIMALYFTVFVMQ